MRVGGVARAVAALALIGLAACSDRPADEAPAAPAPGASADALENGGWPTYGGSPGSTQYSPLSQITAANVDELAPAWTFHTGDLSDGSGGADMTTYQVTPIYADDTLYLCTPYNNIIALDPATGAERWRFDAGRPLTGTMYGSHVCRGVTYWEADAPAERDGLCGRRILELMSTGVLLAVDARAGTLCEDFGDEGRIDLNQLDYKGDGVLAATSPPVVYKNAVIVGGTVIDNHWRDSLDGVVRAFDARTGEELWSWNPIPEELSDDIGGANTWAPISVDVERGWVFLPTGSPSYDTYGANRAEPVPHGNAVVVLDALTGALIWSYQTVRHDLWDYDLPAAPTLIDVARGEETVPAVLQPTKTGFLFLLDRETGEPLFPVEERPVPQTDVPGEHSSPTQPFPTLPAPVTSQTLATDDAWGAAIVDKAGCRERFAALRNEGLFTPPSIEGSMLHPSYLGGTNWGGIAYDAASGLAVVNASNLVSAVTLEPREDFDPEAHAAGVRVYEMRESPYVMLREVLLSNFGAPCNPPPWGTLSAIDMTTGETRWRIPFGRVEFGGPFSSLESWGAPNQGGPIITAGGLVFIGASLDSRFRAYDLFTGAELWSAPTPAPATATPMTYAHDGRQYVVVAAGGHGGFQTNLSDAITAFALPR
ncbi:MAG: pyrroloquinoline quinone-dependent dehydrogenase [Caulobacterales bacterium]|nr:pyrroloquinoline quinone-dependent dehydrogenase [Caulobacterales bacterium]